MLGGRKGRSEGWTWVSFPSWKEAKMEREGKMEIEIHSPFLTLLIWFQGNLFPVLPKVEEVKARRGKFTLFYVLCFFLNLLKGHALAPEKQHKRIGTVLLFFLL